jgi:DNA-binding transcriptional LysR family regulator
MSLRPSSYRLLIAIAEEESFTRAAQRLGVPQPWVSAQVRKLEEDAGFPLFIRSNHPTLPVEPTEPGRQLIAQARRVLAEVDAFDRLMGTLDRDSQPLRIGADPVTIEYEQRTTLLDKVCACHPDLALQIVNMDDEMSLPALRAGNLDICFLTAPAPPSKIFRSKLLGKLQVSLLIPRTHPLASLARVPVSRLRGERVLISTRPTHPLSAKVLAYWQALGVDVQESIDSHVLATTRMAQRLSIMTSTLLDDAPRQWGLTDMVQRPLDDAGLALDFRVVTLRKTQRPGVEKFWSCVT